MSPVIIYAQSVRVQYGEERGWDGFKKVRGRKREILVDTLGIIWGVKVHAAHQGEKRRGFEAVDTYPITPNPPQRILGDHSNSKSSFDILVYQKWGIWPTIKKGTKTSTTDKHGRIHKHIDESNLKPTRWIVERV